MYGRRIDMETLWVKWWTNNNTKLTIYYKCILTEFEDITRSRMFKVDKSGNILGTWYLRLVTSAFWYGRRPGYLFIPGFQLTRNV